MEIKTREHRGYTLEAKTHAGQWQVHIYGIDTVLRRLQAVHDSDMERAFAKAEQRIDDFLDFRERRIGDNDSPTLQARRS